MSPVRPSWRFSYCDASPHPSPLGNLLCLPEIKIIIIGIIITINELSISIILA